MTEDGVKSTDIAVDPKKKFGKDVVLPKKPLSAYLFFTTDQVNKIKEKLKCTHTEAMKKAGEIWNTMNEKERKKYVDMVAKDQIRYDKQLAELNKNGYFKMEDGSKSSDHVKKQKKGKKGNEQETDEDSEVTNEKQKKGKKK